MFGKTAAETELVATKTGYGWNNLVKLTLFDRAVDYVFAVWGGAPSQIFLVVHVGSVEKFLVPIFTLASQKWT